MPPTLFDLEAQDPFWERGTCPSHGTLRGKREFIHLEPSRDDIKGPQAR